MQIDVNPSSSNLSGHLSECFVAATRAFASRSYIAYLRVLFWDLCEQKSLSQWSNVEKAEKLIKATQELPDQLCERLKCKFIIRKF